MHIQSVGRTLSLSLHMYMIVFATFTQSRKMFTYNAWYDLIKLRQATNRCRREPIEICIDGMNKLKEEVDGSKKSATIPIPEKEEDIMKIVKLLKDLEEQVDLYQQCVLILQLV